MMIDYFKLLSPPSGMPSVAVMITSLFSDRSVIFPALEQVLLRPADAASCPYKRRYNKDEEAPLTVTTEFKKEQIILPKQYISNFQMNSCMSKHCGKGNIYVQNTFLA
mgnify:FL=1